MGEIVSIPVRARPRPVQPVSLQDDLEAAIFEVHHNLLVEAMENIGSADLELKALNRLAVRGDVDEIGAHINDEVVISLANALIHVIGARGNHSSEQLARGALLQLVETMEGRTHG